MFIHNIVVKRSFCASRNSGKDWALSPDNTELLVGTAGTEEEYYSVLYFSLEEVLAASANLHLLGACLLLNICINNIATKTAHYSIKPRLYSWEPGPISPDIISADHEGISFIIPFHWTELLSIDITGIVTDWCSTALPNQGLVIASDKGKENLVGFNNRGCSPCEGFPQLVLLLDEK